MLENIIFGVLVLISLAAAIWVIWLERHGSDNKKN